MKSEEQTYWQIHDFLKGRLSGAALESFQDELESDPLLRDELKKHTLANQLVINNRLKLAAQISLETRNAHKRTAVYKKVAVGAAAALMLSLGIYFWVSNERTEVPPSRSIQQRAQKKEEVSSAVAPTLPIQEKALATKVASSEKIIDQPKKALISQEEQNVLPERKESLASVPKLEVTEKAEEKPLPPVLPKKEEINAVKNSCADVTMKAHLVVSNACKGEKNGSITLSRMQGGKAPYHIEVRSELGKHVEENKELASGRYSVIMTDDQHCSTKWEDVLVKEVSCEEEEKVFNPFLGDILELPGINQGGELLVYEKNGNVFYRKEIVANETIRWDGMSLQGGMETGHFVYEIIYHDGSRKHGTITITR